MYVYGVELRVAAVEVSTSGVAEGGGWVGGRRRLHRYRGEGEKTKKKEKKKGCINC